VAAVAKLSPKVRAFLADESVRKALAGNNWPLIGRVLSVPDDYLSADERNFLRALLESKNGRRGKAEIRRIEKALVRMQVDRLIDQRWKSDAAVEQVRTARKRSRSFVYAAAKRRESKKPK
jgi:hypothetical protein